MIIFLLLNSIILSGCGKEKTIESKGTLPVGICEIFDKLPKDIAKSVEVNYGNKIKLLGLTVNKLSRNQLKVSYYWQPIVELGSYNIVFVHFTDKDNKILLQNDHVFCQKHSIHEIKDKFIKETLVVTVPQSEVDKEIYIKMGIYDPKSTWRLKIESAGRIQLDDSNTRAIIEEVKL